MDVADLFPVGVDDDEFEDSLNQPLTAAEREWLAHAFEAAAAP